MNQREEFEKDIYSNVEHTITSGNVLAEKETGRVAAVFYNDYDLDSVIGRIAELEEQLNVATKLLDERKYQIELLKSEIPSIENGTNRYGVDVSYFRNTINRELNRSLRDFRPDELARVLARLSNTADANVMHEDEFKRKTSKGSQS